MNSRVGCADFEANLQITLQICLSNAGHQTFFFPSGLDDVFNEYRYRDRSACVLSQQSAALRVVLSLDIVCKCVDIFFALSDFHNVHDVSFLQCFDWFGFHGFFCHALFLFNALFLSRDHIEQILALFGEFVASALKFRELCVALFGFARRFGTQSLNDAVQLVVDFREFRPHFFNVHLLIASVIFFLSSSRRAESLRSSSFR